jgi:hypothetical protein
MVHISSMLCEADVECMLCQVVHQAEWVYLFTEGYKLYENAGSCQGCDGPTSDAFDLCIAGGFGYGNYATPTMVM